MTITIEPPDNSLVALLPDEDVATDIVCIYRLKKYPVHRVRHGDTGYFTWYFVSDRGFKVKIIGAKRFIDAATKKQGNNASTP